MGLGCTGWATKKESPGIKTRVRADLNGLLGITQQDFSCLGDSWLQTVAGAKPLGRAMWVHLWESGGKEGAWQRICLVIITVMLFLFEALVTWGRVCVN